MTYFYSDKELNYLNRDDFVYRVNRTFAKKNSKKQIVSKEVDELADNETNTISIDGQDFRVIATCSDEETGMDAKVL